MAQKFLDCPYVVSRFQKVCGEGMPEGVTVYIFNQSSCPCSFFYRSLQYLLIRMMSPHFSAPRIC